MNKKTNIILFFSVFLFLSNCSKKVDIEISEIAKSQVSMAVNAFLWRASLDTVSFIPLDIVDPIGGVITTQWYEDTNNSSERGIPMVVELLTIKQLPTKASESKRNTSSYEK